MGEKLPTDDERREVARRLRSFVTDDSVYADVDACRVLHSIGLYYKDIDRIYFSGFDVARLADLIEPSCDRDALLELADEFDGKADYIASCIESMDGDFDMHAVEAKAEQREYARRIREALGVDDG